MFNRSWIPPSPRSQLAAQHFQQNRLCLVVEGVADGQLARPDFLIDELAKETVAQFASSGLQRKLAFGRPGAHVASAAR